jgi:hypothetical protein
MAIAAVCTTTLLNIQRLLGFTFNIFVRASQKRFQLILISTFFLFQPF